ncbi:putative Response regulatory domain-containing protein [Candidatus Magnetomoraceae bacterium gMMP-1]
MEKTKYKLGILDEYQDDIDDFLLFFENDFEVEIIELSENQDEIIKKILEANLDAIAIDYKLMEHNTKIGFNGDVIYNSLVDRLYNFPAFILTNYVPDASKSSIRDEFKIIPKRWMKTGSVDGNELIEKIKFSIIKYKKKIDDAEKELLELIDKKNKNELSAREETRLIELDSMLEKTIDKKNSIPKQWKEEGTEISKLIKLAEDIIKKEKQ